MQGNGGDRGTVGINGKKGKRREKKRVVDGEVRAAEKLYEKRDKRLEKQSMVL